MSPSAEGSAAPAARWVSTPVDAGRAADPMLPASFRVAGKRKELADTWTLELEPDGGGEPSVSVDRYRPGQFSMLYAFASGEVPISVSGNLTGRGPLTHTIRAVGEATRALCALEAGGRLGVRGPFGSGWPLEEAEGGDVVVVAGGIGMAPLRPAIAHLIANRDRYGAAVLLFGARSPAELLYAEELDDWRAGGVDVRVSVDTAPAGYSGRVGLVTTLIGGAGFDGPSTTALICGPEVMMRFAARGLLERGVRPEAVRVSLERNMKCAIGHCGHCQLAHRFVCKDGPVFDFNRVEPLLGVREL